VLAELEAHGVGPVRLWPYGVDTERFHPGRRAPRRDPDQPVTALYVGRLAPEKDLDRLLPLAHTPGVRLVLVGDGPLRGRLERAGRGGDVQFRGWLGGDDLVEAYAEADVFVFPSTTETLGMVLIEAMACGVPVIAADSPTSAEILGGTRSGVLLEPGGWDRLGSVVLDVGAPGPEWHERSTAASARARAWSWTRSTETLAGYYDDVLAAGPAVLPARPPVERRAETG